MKKTLTVNLGGTVFHIDEDAYRLLDNYLSNLKIHFRKEGRCREIIDDIDAVSPSFYGEACCGFAGDYHWLCGRSDCPHGQTGGTGA